MALALACGALMSAVKATTRAEKVNSAVNSLLKLDTSGDKQLSEKELEAALSSLSGKKDARSVKVHALLLYVLAAHHEWAKSPGTTEKKMRANIPSGVSLSADPRVAKLELMAYSYYFAGGKKGTSRTSRTRNSDEDEEDEEEGPDAIEQVEAYVNKKCGDVLGSELGEIGISFDF